MDKARLTDEFLATLVEAARTVGWGVDYIEVMGFVAAVFARAGKTPPTDDELEPYDTVDE